MQYVDMFLSTYVLFNTVYFKHLLQSVSFDVYTHTQFDTGSQKLLDNAERYALYLAEALDDDDNRRRVWQTDNMGK